MLAPARERHDPHKPLRLRTTFFTMADSRRVHDAQAPCRPTETSFWELASLARFASFVSLARFARLARGNSVINRRMEPPTTRAGGQDDVSLTNSLKYGILVYGESFYMGAIFRE